MNDTYTDGLLAKVVTHLRWLAPHVAEQKSAKLLKECADCIAELRAELKAHSNENNYA